MTQVLEPWYEALELLAVSRTENGEYRNLRQPLKVGCNIDSRDTRSLKTALRCAVEAGFANNPVFLLKCGANITIADRYGCNLFRPTA